MERIEQILQRIQGIYYDESAKTNIDIDLMLDYTRVLYADLLEWKKTVPKIEVIAKLKEENNMPIEKVELEETELKNEHTDIAPTKDAAATEELIKKEETAQKESTPESQEDPKVKKQEEVIEGADEVNDNSKKHEEPKLASAVELKANTNSGNEGKTIQEIADDIIYEPSGQPTQMEQEPEDFFFKERPVLSFELPKPEEEMNKELPSTPKKEPASIQNNPEKAIEHIEAQEPETDLPQPLVQEPFEIPSANFSNIFTPVQPSVTIDIRKNIGLNDRYLFLNEMFKNNKAVYEDCLNQINAAKSLAEVQDFLVPIAAQNNWNKEDDTVVGFYAVLAKHFSNK